MWLNFTVLMRTGVSINVIYSSINIKNSIYDEKKEKFIDHKDLYCLYILVFFHFQENEKIRQE